MARWCSAASLALTFGVFVAACAPPGDSDAPESAPETVAQTEAAINCGDSPEYPTTSDTPVGLALQIRDGVGDPLKVRAGQRFYLNQLDMVASIPPTGSDEGVAGLAESGDFADLDWSGVKLADESFVGQPNPDGTWSRRKFYRDAKWMTKRSSFKVDQLDQNGHKVGGSLTADIGKDEKRDDSDSFFIRRLHAIQWTYDCTSRDDCSTAHTFGEEALVEVRSSNHTRSTFKIHPAATSLRVTWSLKPNAPYEIPLTQVENPNWDYGFDMQIQALTPVGPSGAYQPGDAVTFQFTLTDGAGKRLHAPGQMPSYTDFLTGADESGIQYYRFIQEQYATYYRRKPWESQMALGLVGPVQDSQPVRQVVDLFSRIDFNTGIISMATDSQDGFYAAVTGVPSYLALFGGPAYWSFPSTDTWTFTLPADAQPGTYYAVLKARRRYLGEDIPQSKILKIQVGSPAPTEYVAKTGKCGNCHQDGGDLTRVAHAMPQSELAACTTCHVPLSFELEGPIYVRSHFIHSRSNRFDASLTRCKNCHLSRESIQRTSKSACLSCHNSYPDSHVQAYGPIVDMYVGGREESLQQCTAACHTNHPGSQL
ncbi:MAG: cytochrome c3 family protein [Polyangiaceae bacterium]